MQVRHVLRRLGALGRLAVALALLAALGVGTVVSIERTTESIDARRLADRELVVKALAGPVTDWFEAGRFEATELVQAIGGNPGGSPQAIASYLASERRFASSAIAVDRRGQVVGASPDLGVLSGRPLGSCEIVDPETGERSVDAGVQQLVASGSSISAILTIPGECRRRVVAAAASTATGTVTVVVFADPAEALGRIRVGELTGPEDERVARVFLADPARQVVEPGGEPRSAPPRISAFLDSVAAGGEVTQRYPMGEEGGVERVGAYHALTDGWSLVLDQDAGAFDLPPHERPSYIVAGILVVVFAIVFGLLAFFDVRRQRAHRRAEVAKNAFFSVAGHELRTPLTSLKGFIETLAARWDDVTDEQRKMVFDRMLPQARRLDRLIDRLLVAASIQSETHTHPQVAPTQVSETLEAVVEQYRPEAPLHTFVIEVDPDLPQVQGDPKALEQVVGHLVDNAVKYSPTGGTVWIRASRVRRGVEIVVEDEGVGLPSDFSRIFEALVQGESVTKRVHDEGGMGLGLFIVRTLVREMGGKVRAERREPEGTRFSVRLKAVQTRTKAHVGAGN